MELAIQELGSSQDQLAWKEILKDLPITILQKETIALWNLPKCREVVSKAFLHTPLPHAMGNFFLGIQTHGTNTAGLYPSGLYIMLCYLGRTWYGL